MCLWCAGSHICRGGSDPIAALATTSTIATSFRKLPYKSHEKTISMKRDKGMLIERLNSIPKKIVLT